MAANFYAGRRAGSVSVPFSIWLIHIYQGDKYQRTVEGGFNEANAVIFCSGFNKVGATKDEESLHAIAIEFKGVQKVPVARPI